MRIFACLAGVMLAAAAHLAAGTAATHFNEYQHRAIAGDEVNFAVTAADVVRYNGKPLRLEVGGGAAFAAGRA